MNKTLKISLFTLVCLCLSLALIYGSGILVKPNPFTVSNLTEVPNYDVLTWQAQREAELLEDVTQSQSTLSNPYVMVDPYDMNPLSALVMFAADKASDYQISVVSKNAYASWNTTVHQEAGLVILPVIGLYAGQINTVLIQTSNQTVTVEIETERLPADFQTLTVIESQPEQMAPGFTLFVACFDHSYTALLDHDGEVRAYFSNTRMAHGTSVITLSNGHLLATGDELKQVPYNMTSLWEMDWLGKIYKEIEIPNGVHHDISELPNGDILAVSNHAAMFETGTREDVALIIDHQTGVIKKTYDFRTILDEHRDPFTNFHPNIINALNIDWMHMNAAIYDPQHDWLIVSSPIQSQVVAINAQTNEIQWILGPHEGYEGSSSFLAPYLLTPIDTNFEWQWAQHHPMIMADVDRDPDTLDLMMLDNGQVRSFTQANGVAPENNSSRAVHYRIHLINKTVEQIWEYGQERGNELYAAFLGDANAMDNGNTLIAFGGQLKQNGIPVDKIVDGVLGEAIIHSRIVEVDQNNHVVFEIAVLNNDQTTSAETYQAVRVDLNQAVLVSDFDTASLRLGTPIILAEDVTFSIPNLYVGDISGTFNTLVNENGRLIIDGNLLYKGKAYLLGQAVIVLRSFDKTYVFKSNSGLNGRYFSSIDLSALTKGTYELSIAAGIKEGNDVLKGSLHKGYFRTGYKITIQ